MTRIFVVTVLALIIACTELSKTIAAYPQYDSNEPCKVVMLSYTAKLVDENGKTICWGDVEIQGCGGVCLSSEALSWQNNPKTHQHPVCRPNPESPVEESWILLQECVEGVASTRKNISYQKPLDCVCSECTRNDTSCQALTKSRVWDIREERNPDDSVIPSAGEEKRRGNSLSPEPQFSPRSFDFMQRAEWEERNENPSRLALRFYDPGHSAVVKTAGVAYRRANPPSPKSKSFNPVYIDFEPLTESEDQKEDPSRPISRSSSSNYPAFMRYFVRNNRRTWHSNLPPSLHYRVFHP